MARLMDYISISAVSLVAAVMLTACVSTNEAMLSNKKLPPVPIESVQVFQSEQELQGKPFERIAMLEASGDYTIGQGRFINNLRERAAKLGANGIILGEVKTASTGAKLANALLFTPANDKRYATAIRY